MSGKVKTLKFTEDKPKNCKFCYYWGGKKKGCILGGEEKCFYLIKDSLLLRKQNAQTVRIKNRILHWLVHKRPFTEKGDKQGV